MSNIDDRIAHLEKLVKIIDDSELDERNFDKLYNLLQNEYKKEGGESAPIIDGSYHDNLRQTIEKQADSYISAKKRRPIKGAPEAYDSFIYNFRQDVTTELYGLQA